MAITSDTLKEVKAALKSMSKGNQKRIKKADLVGSMIAEIHEKMLSGFTLEDICKEINKTLDEQDRIALNTFRTYVRSARQEAGMKPTRSWTRKSYAKREDQEVKKENRKNDTAADFRDQGGEL